MKDIYILAAKHISAQSPLSEAWMDAPISYHEPYVRSIDPNYKAYFTPNTSRRLGKILKRAILTSRQVMEASGISKPDAIISGTGLGCIENTEFFLDALTREGEELLKPTYFMQSTHNTIGSLIAIDAHCHGYNSTYTHKGSSFECALLDAFMQLKSGTIQTALVGAHDEMTPNYFKLLQRIGYLGHATDGFAGETALAMMLGVRADENALCRLQGIEMRYGASRKELQQTLERFLLQRSYGLEDIDAVMIGANGEPSNDSVYAEICPVLFPGKKLIRYKQLFGESYTASGLGCYAAAVCLNRQHIPAHLFMQPVKAEQRGLKHMLLYNQFENKNHSFILLSS
ncbi:MAG: beta-ketoacyl synthase chain length factor, partial [Tannerellaceae bacterium]|nr:beta-ketoacyl synthase chain length factor [Tannerellaceae bacterium]